MEQYRRRAEDQGKDSLQTVMARVEERVNNIDSKLDTHIDNFNIHTDKDEKNFAGLYKWGWIGIGILSTLQFLLKH